MSIKKEYRKPPLTYQDQLQLLKDRGLGIEDNDKALHLLEAISYYRLSGYWYPLLDGDKKDHKFKEESRFEDAFQMYKFDRELRLLLLGEIEKIEITLRSKLIYCASHKYGAFWYTHKGLFKDGDKLQESLLIIEKEKREDSAIFAREFNKNYINTYLPSWMALELTTFTFLSKLYQNLSDTSLKLEVANYFGINNQPMFGDWIHFVSVVRNVCAHHSRFWNKQIGISAPKPKDKFLLNPWIETNGISRQKAYMAISIIKYFIERINPANTIKDKLMSLFNKYQIIDINAMDFPENWQEQPLWKL